MNMERQAAMEKLNDLVGREVHDLAKEYGVEVRGPKGGTNKGWAGQAFERYLGKQPDSHQEPDFMGSDGPWELKVIPLKYRKDGNLVFKETMAITMINKDQVGGNEFKDSHLLEKLNGIIVARIVGSSLVEPSYVHSANILELQGSLYEKVKKDYDDVRSCINDPNQGFDALTGKMGKYIQPRTKGAGHGSTSRAFYARKGFLAEFIRL